MMQNTSLLLQRHEDLFAGPDTLVVEVDDPELGEVLPGAALHTDLFGLRGAEVRALPVLEARHRRVVVILPKSGERLDMLLASLAGQIERPLELWLVGPAKGGIKGGVSRLRRHAQDLTLVDSARHCKLYRASLQPGPVVGLEAFARRWSLDALQLESYPGVFSHGRLDEGTRELLTVMEPGERKVLDMGCGYGAVSASLAAAGARVTSVDRSATAVAATRATLALNEKPGRVIGSDLYTGVSGLFDEIWTNPPFHEGLKRTLDVTEQLIRQAPSYLFPGGALTLVANLGLGYEPVLRETFARVETLHRSRRFVVLRGRL